MHLKIVLSLLRHLRWHASKVVNRDQCDPAPIDDNLAAMFEVNRDATADVRLHLPQTPIGFVGMTHQIARLQNRIQIAHISLALKDKCQ